MLWASAFPAISVAVAGLGPAGLSVARLGGGLGRAGAGCPVRRGAPTTGPGSAPDRVVRAGRDDRVPAAAQPGGAGGAGRDREPAGGHGAGVRQPARHLVPGGAADPAALGRQRGGVRGVGRHRGVARPGVRRGGADRAGRGGGPGHLPHRAEAPAGPLHRLRGHRVRDVGRDPVHPAVDREPGPRAAARGRRAPSGRRSSSAWRRRRSASCCGPTRWPGWTSAGPPPPCTWCPPRPSSSRWSGWARSPAPSSSSAASSPWPAWSWPAGLAGSGPGRPAQDQGGTVVVRSSRLSSLPLAFLGSASTTTTCLGTLNERQPLPAVPDQFLRGDVWPSRTTTAAVTASIQRGCGSPNTATSATAGCW